MKKRIISLLLLAVMLIGVLPIMSMTVEAASNPYPTWQTVGGVGTIPCTWYAWQQTYDRLGIALPNWGNAINWYYSAPNSGYSVGTTPRANSIAVWTIDGHSYGHVAFVTAVNGSRMVINEGGRTDATGSNGIVNGQDLPSTVGSSWYGRNLVGFVYLDAAPAPVAPTLTWTDYPDKQYIGTTNAVLARRCDLSGVSTASITKLGISMHNYKDERVASFEETVSFGNYSYFQLWYDVNADLGYTLLPGTYYQYYFWAEINGTIYYSSVYSFLTGGTHVHQYDGGALAASATCSTAGARVYTCTTCGETKRESIPALGHAYSYACDTSCYRCGATRTVSHSYTNACDDSCNSCGATRPVSHSYSNATCTALKTCTVCGITSGSALGHTYTNDCDTSCNRCGDVRSITHSYTTTTTKATLTKDGSVVKKCSVCGDVASTTAIKHVKTVKLSTTSYTYDGKVKTPTVTVKDANGKVLTKDVDYTVSYASGRKNLGTYTVTITMKGNYSGSKTLSFKIGLASPTVKAANAATGVKVTWNSVAGAKNYTVYRSVYSGGKWSGWTKIKTGVTGTSYTDTGVKSGTTVRYTVKPYNGDHTAACKTGNSTLFLSQATAKAENAATGVKVTWNKITGAKSYVVYRSVYSGGKWSGWTKIKSGVTGTSYTDTGVKSGTTVRYTVKAVNGDYASVCKTGGSTKFLAQTTVKAENATTGVKVTWGKITGAKSYIVYRSVYSGGKWSSWTKIKTGVTGTSYIDTSVKSGATVRYTVKAVSGDYVSICKTGNTVKYLAQPKVTVAKASNGIKASWGKITGASGYLVYRRTYSNGKWGSWEKIKTTTALNYTDRTAKKGVTYQYTVRAYNGDYKSSYTNSKSIKR